MLFDLHTKYFKKAIAGIGEQHAHERLNTKANHIAWLAGSMVEQRFEMAKTLGVENADRTYENSGELFKNYQGVQDGVTYPSLTDYANDWDAISPKVREARNSLKKITRKRSQWIS